MQSGILAAAVVAASLSNLVFAQEAAKKEAPPPVPWTQAGEFVGKTITIEGRVVSTRRIAHGVSLDFHADFASHFRVIIPSVATIKFKSDPMVRFKDRNVLATGKVEQDRGIPFMRITDPAAIKPVPVRRSPTE